tara:strand:+ start:1779 stop:2402 length:624 start_codon:yes stop_codon:yes gene_type:complete
MSQINVNKVISPDQAILDGPSLDIASNGNVSSGTDIFLVDAANNRFGVGTATPARTLDLSGSRGVAFNAGMILEGINITGSGIGGTVNHDVQTSNAYWWDSAATANWTYNVRYSSSVTLDSQMSVGDMVCVSVVVPVGTSSYYHTALQIDGSAATVEWVGGVAPTQAGSPDDIADRGKSLYQFNIIKTASATFTVLGAMCHIGEFEA